MHRLATDLSIWDEAERGPHSDLALLPPLLEDRFDLGFGCPDGLLCGYLAPSGGCEHLGDNELLQDLLD